MLPHIPILRHGTPYESIDQIEIVHHATGKPVARVSMANPGLITRDVARMDYDVLDAFPMRDLLAMSRQAAELFMSAALPLGDGQQKFDDYVRDLSATTGMPHSYCRSNAKKIHRVLDEMETIIAGLTRGFDLSILDKGYGDDDGRTLSWFREARVFGAVLPSNSPGVHSLWSPAVALKTPIALKPGREEPWTPFRMIQAFIAAGFPKEAFGFYPTDHAGAGALLQAVDRAMLFGDAATTKAWAHDPRIELHGPGYSKVILGDDVADDFEKHLDVIAGSIAANGGRSCINASGVWTPRNGDAIAEALAKKLAVIQALPADDPNAQIAAFANPTMAEKINASIDAALGISTPSSGTPGEGRGGGRASKPPPQPSPGVPREGVKAIDVSQRARGGTPRLVQHGRLAWLLPTIIRCDREHPLAGKEFLFPFAAVVECPTDEMAEAVGPTLVASAITRDQKLVRSLMASPHIDRLNVGPIPTYQLSWDQPHEGNLFEHLYRQRAFQMAGGM